MPTMSDSFSVTVQAALNNPDPDFRARLDLLAALRWAQWEGLSEGVCNHFSVIVPGTTDRFLLNPQGLHWSELTLEDLIVVDPDGNLVEGHHRAEPSAFFIHSRIHLTAPRATCVMHTHMPYATAITCSKDGSVEWCSQNALRYYDRIAYDRSYNGLAFDAAEGDRLASLLGDRDILMMANHGVVVTGPTVAETFDDLYYLERACMIQVLAESRGQPLAILSEQVCGETQQQMIEETEQAELHMQAIKRILLSRYPEILES